MCLYVCVFVHVGIFVFSLMPRKLMHRTPRLMQLSIVLRGFQEDGGKVGKAESPFRYVHGRLGVHDSEQICGPWQGIFLPGAHLPEEVAPNHYRDLHLLRRRARAVASMGVWAMFHIMAQGAEIPDVEGTGMLHQADTALITVPHAHEQLAGPKDSQAGME